MRRFEITFICDRCGIQTPDEGAPRTDTEISITKTIQTRERSVVNGGALDLCMNCANEFEAWIQIKKTKP